MNLSVSLHDHPKREVMDYARSIRDSVLQAHANEPFGTLDDVSSHIKRVFGNPRLAIATNERGTRTEVTYSKQRLLTIHAA